MPSSSTITTSSKSKIKSSLPSSTYKILTATVIRIYLSRGATDSWNYSGLEGAIAFVKDNSKNTFAFKLIDLKGTRGIIWEHELYNNFVLNQDRTFFHSFEGDECLVAFSYADEGEANEVFKKVQNRAKYAKSKSSSNNTSSNSSSILSSKKSHKSKSGGGSISKIDKSLIGAPQNFTHVAHMGFTSEEGFSSRGVDPSWQSLLDQLTNMGVSQSEIRKNEKFIKDFVGQRGGPSKANNAQAQAQSGTKKKKVPPPAPSRNTTTRKPAPPPPAPRGSGIGSMKNNPNSSSTSSNVPPPPPPPPPSRPSALSSGPPPPPPPPPSRPGNSSAPPPPPPPPAPPARRGGGGPPPPPPPPPAAAANLPPPQDGRANLLASIQGKSIANLKKTDPNSSPSTSTAAAVGLGAGAGAGAAMAASSSGAGEEEAGGGGDLASALAAALNQRKGNMGDSDEEEESDDDW